MKGSMQTTAKTPEEQPIAAQASDVTVPQSEQLNAAQVAAVVKEHGGFVWRVLRRRGVEEGLLEDASQEVFLVVFRKLGEFEGRSSLRTWLYRICVNVADQIRRSHRRQRELLGKEPAETAVAATQAETMAASRLRERLDKALAELDEGKRSVFVLFEIEGLPMTEVAEATGSSLSTAYSRLYAAREQVERALRRAQRESSGRPLSKVG